MDFKRRLFQQLLDWKKSTDRKPLIIRGARQVGKSTLVTQLGRTYSHFITLNLEKKEYKRIFENIERTSDILNAIFLQTNTPKNERETLLFIDEIQESPKAIQQLRYFYEEYPELHVIAAGSLLEFAMREVASFPVGRVRQIVLHPFDFGEYLLALDLENAAEELNKIPAEDYAHSTLLKHFNDYAVIGGMPEAIKRFVEQKTMANLPEIYDDLWQSYREDVEKYAQNVKERNVIRYIMETAASEKDRITFAGFANSNYSAREVGEAFRSLDRARIIQLIYPFTGHQPPIVPDIKRKPRLQFLDTGLLNHALGHQGQMVGIENLHSFFSGKIIQHLVVQEVMAQFPSPMFKPMFWVREKANSSSEVDLVLQAGKHIVPIEVKSGKQGRLRSLHQFMDHADHPYAVRLLANHFSVEEVKTPAGTLFYLMNLPYYLASKLPEYIQWFFEKY